MPTNETTPQPEDAREPFTPKPAPELDEVLKIAEVVGGANATTDTGMKVEANPIALDALKDARQKAIEAGQEQLPPRQ